MSKFDRVKKYYDARLWNTEMVKNAVVKEWITPEEFKTITGNDYDPAI